MKWEFIRHCDLSSNEKYQIAKIKDQHWPYGINSQLEWMKKNIRDEDVHLIGKNETENRDLIAYLTLTKINILIDTEGYEAIGVGGVCVEKKHQHIGLGQNTMKEASAYISNREKIGVLLCKDSLIKFYDICGWKKLKYKKAITDRVEYSNNIMVLDYKKLSCDIVTIDRIF